MLVRYGSIYKKFTDQKKFTTKTHNLNSNEDLEILIKSSKVQRAKELRELLSKHRLNIDDPRIYSTNIWPITDNIFPSVDQPSSSLMTMHEPLIKTIQDIYELISTRVPPQERRKLLFDLKEQHPEFSWNIYESGALSKNHWDSRENTNNILDFLSSKLGSIHTYDSWVSMTNATFIELGASSMIKHYGNSIVNMLCWLYSEIPNSYHKISPDDDHSTDDNNRRRIDEVAYALSIESLNDWMKVTVEQFSKRGGSYIIKQFGHKLYDMLTKTYPEFLWNPYMRDFVPQNYWDSSESTRNFIDYAGIRNNVRLYSEWDSVANKAILDLGARRLLERNNEHIFNILTVVYPEYSWSLSQRM
eukprot:TRINITY_DN8239_c0_g1_i1.p1 TRINITY_DN8239_c0_g1~~TRINITY_DN8239_c0_g1_i1.p1  ORF type:complete len:359 (-),score=42.15 TRINITY_DN8239_c0_g1_i1:851-1927(-)